MPREPKKGKGFFLKLLGLTEAPGAGRVQVPAEARVTPDPTRCVQCGACGYNCPVGIPVRDFARQGKVVDDARCVQCGQCIEACPRGTLRWNMAPMRGPTNGPLSNSEGVLYDELMSVFNQPASAGEGQR